MLRADGNCSNDPITQFASAAADQQLAQLVAFHHFDLEQAAA